MCRPLQINLWMGVSESGSSSGLHHDFHDNLYVLLRGRKRFRLFDPSMAAAMYLHGTLAHVHANGRIVYKVCVGVYVTWYIRLLQGPHFLIAIFTAALPSVGAYLLALAACLALESCNISVTWRRQADGGKAVVGEGFHRSTKPRSIWVLVDHRCPNMVHLMFSPQ